MVACLASTPPAPDGRDLIYHRGPWPEQRSTGVGPEQDRNLAPAERHVQRPPCDNRHRVMESGLWTRPNYHLPHCTSQLREALLGKAPTCLLGTGDMHLLGTPVALAVGRSVNHSPRGQCTDSTMDGRPTIGLSVGRAHPRDICTQVPSSFEGPILKDQDCMI